MKVEKRFTTGGSPYAAIILSCGHYYGAVELIPRRNRCNSCGDEHDVIGIAERKCPACGYEVRACTFTPDSHNEDHWVLPEAEPECETCQKHADQLDQIPDLVAQSTHSRFRGNCWTGDGYITFYRRDPTSPSGVMAIGAVAATDKAVALIRKLDSRISPLSPTEGLRRA